MKNITPKLAPLAIAFLALLTACEQKKIAPAASTKPRVLVSNPPTAWLVKQIAGDKVDIQTLAGSGGCGHEFQPTDKEMVEASKADIWFTCGLEFEGSGWAESIHAARTDLGSAEHGWMSLGNLADSADKIQQTLDIRFPGLLPDDRTFSGAAATGFVTRIPTARLLRTRHTVLLRDVAPKIQGVSFLADHPAYTHFAADYGLKQIAIEEDHHEATDADLVRVIAEAKAAGVKVLFLSSEGHRSEAETIAKAVGAQVILADPNTENTPELLGMMANALVKAHAK